MDIMKIQDGSFYIGDVPYVSHYIVQDDMDFTDIGADRELLERVFNTRNPVSRRRQAEFIFNSGWSVSVAFGTMNLCENLNRGMLNDETFKEEVQDVEISIIHTELGICIDPDDMSVDRGRWTDGYADANRVKEILLFTSRMERPHAPHFEYLLETEIEVNEDLPEDLPDENF